MNENGNEKKKSSGCLKAAIILIGIIVVIAIGVQVAGNRAGRNIQVSGNTWNCTEYDPPYDVVFIDGEVDVYGGVDEPSSAVKGHVTDGAAGIEARCSGSRGSFYRLKGVDWWGWVKTSDTYN